MKGPGAPRWARAWRRLNGRMLRNISTLWLLVVTHQLQNVSIIMQGEGCAVKQDKVVSDLWQKCNIKFSFIVEANYSYLFKSKCTNCMSSEISISTVAWGLVYKERERVQSGNAPSMMNCFKKWIAENSTYCSSRALESSIMFQEGKRTWIHL